MQKKSFSLQCATRDELLTAKVQHGLCRSCYKREYHTKYRQSKRNVAELDEVQVDSIVIPPFKRPTFDLNADKQAATTSDGAQQSQSCLYGKGLIAACGLEHKSKQHQDLMKTVLQTSNLEPFGIFLDHCEINAMTTSKSVFTLFSVTPSQVKFAPCLPPVQKQIATMEMCNNFGDVGDKGIMQRALARSPFYNAVKYTELQPLNDDMIQILNGDWRFQPCLRFAASRLLVGGWPSTAWNHIIGCRL